MNCTYFLVLEATKFFFDREVSCSPAITASQLGLRANGRCLLIFPLIQLTRINEWLVTLKYISVEADHSRANPYALIPVCNQRCVWHEAHLGVSNPFCVESSLSPYSLHSAPDRSYTSGLNSSAVEQTHSMVAGMFPCTVLGLCHSLSTRECSIWSAFQVSLCGWLMLLYSTF